MSLTKKMRDKKVNFEFNKEFISLFSKKIKENDTNFLNKTLKELHPSDSADIIENLVPENRSKLIELEGFSLDPEIFIELNESIQAEIFILLSIESIANILRRLESDNALKILENFPNTGWRAHFWRPERQNPASVLLVFCRFSRAELNFWTFYFAHFACFKQVFG